MCRSAGRRPTNDDAEEPDGITARRVAKLLEQHKDGPFFIAAGFHKPHVPHTAPKKYFDMYPAAKMPLPEEPAGHAKYIPEIAHPAKYYPELTHGARAGDHSALSRGDDVHGRSGRHCCSTRSIG